MPSRTLEFLAARRTRVVVMWVVLVAAIVGRGVQGWINFRDRDRPDRNDGHTGIDFGGQWMMGRLIVLGHGRDLYSRARHLEVARIAYPRDREAPDATDHDAERLVGWYIGPKEDPVGGPLYPPVHALVMVPLALIPDPYLSYRIAQGIMLGLVLVAGAGVRYLSGGRWWWSAATFLLLMFPGCRGGIDLGQNSPLTLALLIWGWAFMVRGRPGWGGVLLGMLAFKPVWAVSFLAALLVLRQWRAALAMTATGAAWVLVSLPFVGLQAWFDWLHVGQLAADAYSVDRNWIFLSRDLFGIPRRIFQEYDDGRAVRSEPVAAYAGWVLWTAVAGVTLVGAWVGMRHRPTPGVSLTGPLAAFVVLAAWLCTYRFMYYDALVAVLGVVLLMADPRPFFRRAWWPFASWAPVLVALMLIVENVTAPFNVEVSASVMYFKKTVTGPGGSTHLSAPAVYFATGDEYPWDTALVFALWVWCLLQMVRAGRSAGSHDLPLYQRT